MPVTSLRPVVFPAIMVRVMRLFLSPPIALLALLGVAASSPEATGDVTVTVDEVTFPVRHGDRERPNYAPVSAPKLDGRASYTTRRLRLENDYLIVDILPEFAGRIHRVRYKPGPLMPEARGPVDLFWHLDHLPDKVPWAFGAGRFSFPFYEHGRHLDETAGYTVLDLPDGGKMVALDTRFDTFLKPEETKRYGRATPLRLGQYVTLRPKEAKVRWEAVVSNPMPMRAGMKLWHLLRQRNAERVEFLVPTATMTGHGAPNIADNWRFPHTDRDRAFSLFSVAHAHDFAGWFFPDDNLNVIRIADRKTAPGTKVVSYPPGTAGYNEIWTGSHTIFEGPGRMLPAFGGSRMTLDILPAAGIGRIDFANDRAAVNVERGPRGWTVRLLPTTPVAQGTLTVTSGGKVYQQTVNITPHRPSIAETPLMGDRITVTLTDARGNTLLEAALPVDPGEPDAEAFAALKALMAGDIPGGGAVLEEAHGLVAEHGPSLWKGRSRYAEALREGRSPSELVHAARRLLRVDPDHEAIERGLKKVLTAIPNDPHANLYYAIHLLETDRAETARDHLERAAALPGGAFLLALDHVRRGDLERADELFKRVMDAEVDDTFTAPGDGEVQALRQPGVYVANYVPALYHALHLHALGREQATTERLRQLPPHIVEGWMVLEAEERLKTFRHANPAGYGAAERLYRAARESRWLGVPYPNAD